MCCYRWCYYGDTYLNQKIKTFYGLSPGIPEKGFDRICRDNPLFVVSDPILPGSFKEVGLHLEVVLTRWTAVPASAFYGLINLFAMIPHWLFRAVLPLFVYCSVSAQNSPFSTIIDYGGGALDSAYSLSDTTFCKGSVVMLRGLDLTNTGTGDTFDSLVVRLDTFSCQIVQLNTSTNPGPDTLIFQIPDRFIGDTCLPLYLIKYISNSFGQFPYPTLDTICLTGDYVEIVYPDSSFCLGDSNPIPSIFTTTDTLGSFCCYSASPGFLVQPNGEILLHPGAVGSDQSFLYTTTHAVCPDTNSFQVDILQRTSAVASYSGVNSASYCPSGYVLADTTNLFPIGGHFSCSDSNLVLVNDSIGLIDLGTSPPGIYQLEYRVSDPCVNSAMISIEILTRDSVSVGYPIPYQGPYQRICPNQPAIAPLFTSGQSGGSFVALPNSLVLDSNGVIDPALSQAGNYTVMYVSPGSCPDTAIVSQNLSIDTLPDASFVILPEEVCAGDSVLLVDSVNVQGIFQILDQGMVIHSDSLPIFPVFGTLTENRTYLIQHIASDVYCSDTAYDYLSVLESGNAAFAYDPDFYCLGDPNPIPLIYGDGGGAFQAISSSTVVDSIGRIDVSASGPGIHIIQYNSPGACPDSLIDTVQINNSVNAFFTYPASQFCKTDSSPLPTVTSTGGFFAVNNPGLVLDSTSGLIDLQGSSPGFYEVTYSFVGSCQTSYSTNVLILDFPGTPTLEYPGDTFCRESSPPIPIISTDSSGTFLGSAGVVFLNPITGALDLALMQSGGPYIVKYDIANPCAIDPVDSIFIREAPFLELSYSTIAVCQDQSPMAPSIQLQPNAGISFAAPNELAISANGYIIPNQSQAGTYTFHCQTDSYCPAMDSVSITIHPLPQSATLQVLPDTTICIGEGISATLTATDGVSFRFLLNGHLLDSTFFRIDLDSLSHGDQLTGIIENVFGCTDSIIQTITVLDRPHLSINPPSGTVLESGIQSLTLESDLPQTIIDWSFSNELEQISSGTLTLTNPGIGAPIPIAVEAFSLDPARYQFQAVPITKGCQGDTLNAAYLFLEAPFFIPEVITPNGDGKNDQWQVVWRDQIDPNHFEILVFNRAGGQVHRMGATSSWDGGSVPDGVYWWLVRNQHGQEFQRGGLTIRRK